jgi:hypothetical protein
MKKKEDEKQPPTQMLVHAAVSSAAVPAIIENNTVIELYNKVSQRYNLPMVKTVEDAIDCGNWVKSEKPWDPDKVMKGERLMLDNKSRSQVTVLETYLCGKADHPAIIKEIEKKKEESRLIKEGKRKGKVEPIMLSGAPLRKDQRYILVMGKTKQVLIRPTEAICKMEFSHCKSLAAARKEDKEMADNLVQYMIAKTAKAFNIKRNISPDQIRECLENIALEYPHYKLSEIYYVLRKLKMGRYGQIFERLDEQTIMSVFDRYEEEERFPVIEQRHYLKHDQVTAGEKGRAYTNFFPDLIKQGQRKENEKIKEKAERLAGRIVDNFFVNEKVRQMQDDGVSHNFDKPKMNGKADDHQPTDGNSDRGGDDAKSGK